MAERDLSDFGLSPAVYIQCSDLLAVFKPSLRGLLCTRDSPRARHAEGAWCCETVTCPISRCSQSQADGQSQAMASGPCTLSGKPWQSPAAGSLPGIINLPVLRHHPSLLLKLCLGRESSSQRPLHKPTHTTTALLRKMIHWCLKIPQTGALADFMTNFPRRHRGRQSLMLRLASTPCEYLSAITTDSRARSLHIIPLFVHKFPLKGLQRPHTASSQAFRLLKPSQPDRMVPLNYKQHGTIFYYNARHYYF